MAYTYLAGVKFSQVMYHDHVVKDGVEYHAGYYIADKNISAIEGKLLTTVELLGLPDEQREALKSEIRQTIWGRGFLSYGTQLEAEEVAEFLPTTRVGRTRKRGAVDDNQ